MLLFTALMMSAMISFRTFGKNVVISGIVKNPKKGKILIQEEFQKGEFSPEQEISLNPDHTFRKVINVENPAYYHINFFNVKKVKIILNERDVRVMVNCAFTDEMLASGKTPQITSEDDLPIHISGSPEYDFINGAYQGMNQFDPDMQSIMEGLHTAGMNQDSVKLKELEERARHMMQAKGKVQVVKYIKSHPINLGTMDLLQNGFKIQDQNAELYENTASELIKKYPNSMAVKTFCDEVREKKYVEKSK